MQPVISGLRRSNLGTIGMLSNYASHGNVVETWESWTVLDDVRFSPPCMYTRA